MKKVKKFIKSNIKLVIGIMIGLVIAGSIGVYAATVISANNVSFSGSTSGLTSTNMQDALNEAYNNCKTKCPEGNVCTKTWAKIGDYVQMIPTSTSYTTDTSMTGRDSPQTLNPSELNLWRIIRVNSDGTIEMVSKYVSNTYIGFNKQTGYKNYVGYLNTIAHQYENSSYTIGSRHMGYSNQTPYITDTTALTSTTAPQTSDTSSSNVTNTRESTGLGDIGYLTDYNLVNTACGTLVAYQKKEGKLYSSYYWLASRLYRYVSSTSWYFNGRFINPNGNLDYGSNWYYYDNGSFQSNGYQMAVRPIVILKSGITPSSGDGSSTTPYVLP